MKIFKILFNKKKLSDILVLVAKILTLVYDLKIITDDKIINVISISLIAIKSILGNYFGIDTIEERYEVERSVKIELLDKYVEDLKLLLK